MKKILTVLIATLLIGTTAFAQESFNITETEMTVETGQPIQLNYTNAEDEIEVKVCNEYEQEMWSEYFNSEVNGELVVTMPECNPLTTAYLHVINKDTEKVVKVNFVKPHEHQPHHVDFIRPTETEAGRMEYFYCDCGKYFEDRACTKEITEPIDEWSYIAPVPREQWGEGNPVPYIPKYDDKQTTDNSKPNPSWTEKQVEEYYEQEEVEVQQELEERKAKSELVVESNEDNEIIESELVVKSIETNEAIEPVTFAVEPVKVEKELTFWERIKEFFINLFN